MSDKRIDLAAHMSRRDYIAITVAPKMLELIRSGNQTNMGHAPQIIREFADAMLDELDKHPRGP